MSTLVVYYSKSGSNRFLAEKIKNELNCDIEELRPIFGGMFFILLSILTRISMGNKKIKSNPGAYKNIILCGPIWVGAIITPLTDFVSKYLSSINNLYYITSCGSTDSTKSDRFGYSHAFVKLEDLAGEKLIKCEALPIELVLDEADRNNDDKMMKTRLNNENFRGKIEERLMSFLRNLV